MYYHIKFIEVGGRGECKTNISEDILIDQYVTPYLNGHNVMIKVRVLNQDKIHKVKITSSTELIDSIISNIEFSDKSERLNNRNRMMLPKSPPEWRAIDQLLDVTDTYIKKPPIQKNATTTNSLNVIHNDDYVNRIRIDELKAINCKSFDLSKLIKLCEELNDNWHSGNYFSVIALLRTILNYVPPIFKFANFEQIVSNYAGGTSFKKTIKPLLDTSKNIADNHLHSQAQKTETLPNNTQVDFKAALDVLLSEVIKLTKS